MVFKSVGWGGGDYRAPAPVQRTSRQRQERDIVAYVGSVQPREGKTRQGKTDAKKQASTSSDTEWTERLTTLNNGLFGYNTEAGRVLLRVTHNDRKFDEYIGLPFTKGVTERETGRTMIMLATTAHHGEAMQNQFDGALWDEKEKSYGNCIRWLNVGDLREGFIGLDYQPHAKRNAGVATSVEEVSFLAKTLMQYGFNERTRLYLLQPPHVMESTEGIALRKRGLERLVD
ncbi:hypothetical protein HYX13_05600 [Candidatus Woesearchaeota archaeon]|nr:hypothetical protein [Candidatus Woesearchaeota archaeon]